MKGCGFIQEITKMKPREWKFRVYANEEEPDIVWDAWDLKSGKYHVIEKSAYDEIESALRAIIELGKRDLTNPKYDDYFDSAKEILKRHVGGGNNGA